MQTQNLKKKKEKKSQIDMGNEKRNKINPLYIQFALTNQTKA